MNDDDKQSIYEQFKERVNMAPSALERWLQTAESKAVGDRDDGESTGHASGRRIVQIKRTKKAELSDGDYRHMQRVNGYIARHTAQRPDKSAEELEHRSAHSRPGGIP